MIDYERLLGIQQCDTRVNQIRHRVANLAERDELVNLVAQLATAQAANSEAEERRAELFRREKRFEDEAQLVDDKATSERERMYSGEITVPKELEAIQMEIASLRRRQTELEDEALDLMELIEPVDAELSGLAKKLADIESAQTAATKRLETAEVEGAAELASVETERGSLATELDDELVVTYEKVRTQQQGIAVSRLVGTTCDGCHLGLSAVELDRVRHEAPDVLVFHEECGRILVR